MILLLLAMSASDPVTLTSPDTLMSNARARLTAPCDGAGCAMPPRRSAFRIDSDDTVAITAKDRAIADDGSKCNVVGARRCPKRGRTLFRTGLGQ